MLPCGVLQEKSGREKMFKNPRGVKRRPTRETGELKLLAMGYN